MRKTFDIRALVEKVNEKNRTSTCSRDTRDGWNSLLSSILMDADVYAGYNFLGPEDVPAGQLAGIRFATVGGQDLTPVEYFERLSGDKQESFLKGQKNDITPPEEGDDIKCFPDESRRFYYLHSKLY